MATISTTPAAAPVSRKEDPENVALIYKHSLAVRWFHWINFPVLALMVWSGLLIYWANDVYRIGWGSHTLLHFFPERFYKLFQLDFKLAEGMAFHFFLMWIFIVNGVLYVLYTAISGEWRAIVPNRRSFKEAVHVVMHDLHLTRVAPPRRKFNGAQQIAYTTIIVMGALATLTGLAIYKPVQLAWLTQALGGYVPARWEHFWLMLGFVAFFVVHIIQVMRAGWNNYRSMITGYELAEAPDGKAASGEGKG